MGRSFVITGLVLRGLEFIFTIINLGLIGAIEARHTNPESINYSIFAAAWTMATLFLLIPVTYNRSWGLHIAFIMFFDVLNVIFNLSAAVTLAAKTRGQWCGNRVRIRIRRSKCLGFTLTAISSYRTSSITTRSLGGHKNNAD